MALKWRMSHYAHGLYLIVNISFIYASYVFPQVILQYVRYGKSMVLLMWIKILHDNSLLRRNSAPTRFDIFVVM